VIHGLPGLPVLPIVLMTSAQNILDPVMHAWTPGYT
jgi:hypothetical protein